MESVLQRLGFLVDTSGLLRGQAAMDSAAAAGIRLGSAADVASVKLSAMGRGPAQANLQNVSTQMDRAATATRGFNQNAEQVSSRLSTMGVAAATVAGVLAFQLVGAIASVVSELAGIPLESAKAQDALTRFNAQLTIAFRGSAEVVRQARGDIIDLARDAGVPLAQLRRDYADMAIVGRSAGLTRTEVTGVVGAFAQLGQISGADEGALARSMYQVQQMMNTGQVRWSDFKLADLNLPAFGLAVEQGMGISSSEMIGRIGRGDITVDELLRGLVKGAEKLLDEAGGELPQTMARAQAAMESEWTILLENMGEAFRTSEFVQSLQTGVTDFLSMINNAGQLTESPEQSRDRIMGELVTEAYARDQEAIEQRAARQRNGMGVASNLDPIRAAQADVLRDIGVVHTALNDTTGMTSDQVAELNRGLRLLEGQISRIESAVDRARRQARESRGDLDAFGPGGGYDLARSARGLYEQSITQLRPISLRDAMGIVRAEWITGAQNDLGQAANENANRQSLLDAAGRGVDGRRNAQLDLEETEYRNRFGRREDMSSEQADAVDQLASENRVRASERMEIEDRQRMADRARIERDHLDALREQLQLGVQLGVQGRITLAQAERERVLRAEVGDLLANELLPAERARVAENILLTEQLGLQAERMAALQDAAETAGGVIGDVLGASISEGIERGKITGEAALEALGRSADRILNDLLSTFTRPLEQQLTNYISSRVQGWMGNGANDNGEAVDALAGAAQAAGEAIADELTPAVAGSVVKLALSTAVMSSENAARTTSLLAMSALTSSVVQATVALEIMAASAATSAATQTLAFIPGFADGVKNFSGGWAMVGEAGPELVSLPKGASVYPHGQSKDMMGGSEVTIQIIDQRGRGAPVETEETRGPNGERMIKMLVRDEVKSTIGSGGADREMNSRFGASRAIAQR